MLNKKKITASNHFTFIILNVKRSEETKGKEVKGTMWSLGHRDTPQWETYRCY